MEDQNYQINIDTKVSPEEAFIGINNVPAWWSTNFEGTSDKLDDTFTVRFGETSITLKVVELTPAKKIQWLVTDCYKHWLKDKKEWVGTRIEFNLTRAENDHTKIEFTHIGLIPGLECYDGCEDAWSYYLTGSLTKLLTEGQGIPE